MVPVTFLIAHGGTAGTIVESLVFVTVVAILVAIWLRERRGGDQPRHGPARLRDDDEST